MANVVVLGSGLMGSAFCVPLADNRHNVSLVGTFLDGDIIEELHESSYHPTLKLTLPKSIKPYTYDRLDEVIADADLVVLGVNSLGVEWAAKMLSPLLPADTPVLMLTKGLEGDGQQLQTLPEVLRRGFPADKQDSVRIVAVGGPSIAGELAVRRDTCVVLAGTNATLLEQIAQLLRTPYYHVWTSTDFIGVETCVALKNIYALAVGLVHGLLERDGVAENQAVMHNLSAAIFAQGLMETSYMVELMGGQQRTVLGLPAAGDLYVTSMGGRNGRMGRLLGLGMTYSDAKRQHMADVTIEGAELAMAIGSTVEQMVQIGKLDGARIPLMRTMIQIVCNDAVVSIPWEDFFAEYRNV